MYTSDHNIFSHPKRQFMIYVMVLCHLGQFSDQHLYLSMAVDYWLFLKIIFPCSIQAVYFRVDLVKLNFVVITNSFKVIMHWWLHFSHFLFFNTAAKKWEHLLSGDARCTNTKELSSISAGSILSVDHKPTDTDTPRDTGHAPSRAPQNK